MSRIVLIGCGRAKAREPSPAAELYSGSLFRARRTYAEGTGVPWWIVSAEYGLVPPDALLRPYDLRLTDLAEIDRSAWRLRTVAMLLDELDDDTRLREVSVELHMGADYAEGLADVLLAAGLTYSWPVQHLGIGKQMAWYAAQARRRRIA